MNAEDDEAMRALDARLGRLYGNLDTSPGFEDRLQARIAALAAARARPLAAEARERLEREHAMERAAVDRAARVDSIAVAIGGLGSALGLWRFAPEISRWYAATVEQMDPVLVAFGGMAVIGAAAWALLRRFDVNPRTLVGA